MDIFPEKYSCCLTWFTDTDDQTVDGTGKVLDNSNKLLPVFCGFFSNGAAPLSKL